jgi:predicted membrane channel-forming protein YqfA (hemolysin III family)
MAFWVGWIAVLAIALSATIPLGFRFRMKRRASPDSTPIRFHIALGTVTTVMAFAHALFALSDLGSSAVLGGGFMALMMGGVAFMLLIAHAGIGIQLRDVRLRDRIRQRRRHVGTACAIAVAVMAHVWLLRAGD